MRVATGNVEGVGFAVCLHVLQLAAAIRACVSAPDRPPALPARRTAEAEIAAVQAAADVAPQAQDDFDIEEDDGAVGGSEVALLDRPEVQEKLRRRISSCNVKVCWARRGRAGCLGVLGWVGVGLEGCVLRRRRAD